MGINLQNLKKYTLALYIIIFTITSSEIANRICLITTVGICGISYLTNADFRYKGNYYIRALLLYGIMLLASMFYTISPEARAIKHLTGYVTMFVVVFFVVDSIRTIDDVKFFLKVFIMAALANCVATYARVGSEAFELLGNTETQFRLSAEEQNANVVGMCCAYGAIFSLHFLTREKPGGRAKVFYMAAFVINFVFGLLTGSRKALLMLFAGTFLVLYYKSILDKNAIKVLGKVLGAIIAVIALFYYIMNSELFSVIGERLEGLIAGFVGGNKIDHSTMDRMYMTKIGWQVFWQYPIIGQGVCASYRYFLTYSHSNIIEILMNTGIVGFFIFYKPFFTSIVSLFKQDRKDPLYPIMLFIIFWLLFGGFGLVFYYSKSEMTILAIATSWLILKEKEKNVKKNEERSEKS
ncbi:MAG: O-antigen ligase family protein [Clostridia bacterium]|nr:O-antigen ligase family protein [Clostridia bacterium]